MSLNNKIQRKNQFKPGDIANPNGRRPGTPNRVTSEMRGKVVSILENNWEKIQTDIDSLEPKDRLIFLEKLMSYTLPKMQLIKGEMEVRTETGAEGLSSSELTQFILNITPHDGN